MRHAPFSFAWGMLAVGLIVPPEALAQARHAAPVTRRPARPQPAPKNPVREIQKLQHMSPEERQRVLQSLPPERRKKVEERLEQYSKMSPQEQQRLKQDLEMFQQLPPERQNAVRKLYSDFQKFPPDRQKAIKKEFKKLRSMREAERKSVMSSEEFQKKYNRSEQDFLNQMVGGAPH